MSNLVSQKESSRTFTDVSRTSVIAVDLLLLVVLQLDFDWLHEQSHGGSGVVGGCRRGLLAVGHGHHCSTTATQKRMGNVF